jgi:hypothetical protein
VNTNDLTADLAKRVMGWGIAPDRFLTGGRQWMPRWRFQPLKNVEDAFRLLEAAAPAEYDMRGGDGGDFHVRVRIGNTAAEARSQCKPRAITCAIARALGIEVEPWRE